jgi:hypothetical protein
MARPPYKPTVDKYTFLFDLWVDGTLSLVVSDLLDSSGKRLHEYKVFKYVKDELGNKYVEPVLSFDGGAVVQHDEPNNIGWIVKALIDKVVENL